jgi:DNA-binding Lrp family transcriptional regulator
MLDDLDRRALDLAAGWWRLAGTRNEAVRELLGESPAEYHRRLARLLDDPAATAYAPVLVRRLRRQRDRRLGARSGRRLAG